MSGLDKLSKLLGAKSGSDLLNQVGDGFFGTDYQKDYAHASKLMRPNGLALAPKQKFLFHVYFNLSDPSLLKSSTDKGLVGALVKSVQLPSFKLDTEEYIQYNRKRLVHNKIMYEPITIKLHDDGEGNVLDMWNSYYQYHFADSKYDYNEGIQTAPGPNGKATYGDRDLYNRDRVGQQAGWGKTITSQFSDGNRKPAFFKDIKIYGFNRGGYIAYTLINPVITAWNHDTYDYAESNGVMEHSVTLQYEAVKYSDNETVGPGGDNVDGFGHNHPGRYDTTPGALGPGSTASLFGQGGITDTLSAISTDLANGNIAGAIQKAGASGRTFGSIDNLRDVVTGDLIDSATTAGLSAISNIPKGTLNFPTGGNTTKNVAASPKKVG